MDIPTVLDRTRDVLSRTIFTLNGTPVTAVSLLALLVAIALTIALARVLGRLLLRRVLRRSEMDEGIAYSITRATEYAIVAVGLMISLQLIGLDLTALGLVFGLLSLGLGFGLQNLTANFVSGLILLIERPVKLGDRVQIGEAEGDVIAINMRATVVRGLDHVSLIVPNADLISHTVVNWSHLDRRIRLSVPVGVSYRSDVDVVIETLLTVARTHPQVLGDPPAHVRLVEFGDSAWNMELLVWLPDAIRYRDVRSELNIAIVRAFREHGIEIPYPQRDVHLPGRSVDITAAP